MNPTVSVIVPTYNYKEVLQYALQSILAQTFRDFEVLVIGDGCTDGTGDLVQSFEDERIRWHNLPLNHGHKSAPINKGFALASGKYVTFLGQDDLWFPDHLETVVTELDKGADFVFTCGLILQKNSRIVMDGISPTDTYYPDQGINFILRAHTYKLYKELGGWANFRDHKIPPHDEILERILNSNNSIVSINTITALKFQSLIDNLYIDKPTDRQAKYLPRVLYEPTKLRYELLMEYQRQLAERHPGLIFRLWKPGELENGEAIKSWRKKKGLPAEPNA